MDFFIFTTLILLSISFLKITIFFLLNFIFSKLDAFDEDGLLKSKPTMSHNGTSKRLYLSRKSVYMGPDAVADLKEKLSRVIQNKARRGSIQNNAHPQSNSTSNKQINNKNSSRNLKELLVQGKKMGQKIQLLFGAEVSKFEVCNDNSGTHVMYTVSVQATICIGTHRETSEWDIQQRYRTFYQLHGALKQRYVEKKKRKKRKKRKS